MNINDLPQGSYQEVTPQKLNINNLPQGSYSDAKPSGESPTPPPQPSFFQRMSQAAGKIGVGIDKEILSLPFKTAELGSNIANATIAKVPGLGFTKTDTSKYATPSSLQPKGTLESIGSIGAQIGEFFLPGSLEKSAIEGIDTAVNSIKDAKFIEQFGAEAGPKVAQFTKGLLKTLGSGAVTGASAAGVTSVQSGGDIEKVKTAGEFGFGAGVLGKVSELIGPKIAKSLQESALKLSPTQKVQYGSKMEGVTDYLTQEIGAGTPTMQYNKVNAKINGVGGYESTLQSFLKNDAAGKTVIRDDLINKLDSLKSEFQDERDVLNIEKQIDGLKNTLTSKWPEQIPLDRLNNLKRSTYNNAYNKRGTEMLDWVEGYMGNVLKTSIEDATKGMKINGISIEDFNKMYGNAINAKTLLKMAKNKSQVGLTGKAILLLLGSPAGIPGEIAGLALGGERGLIGGIKTGAGALSQSGSTAPFITKMGLGLSNPSSQSQKEQQP